MLQAIQEALKCREERVEFLGKQYLVREVNAASSLEIEEELEKQAKAAGSNDQELHYWALFTRSILDAETGLQAFTDADIAVLRHASRVKLAAFTRAVNNVNGLNDADNAKNSKAVQV
jgi:hypothetical protein